MSRIIHTHKSYEPLYGYKWFHPNSRNNRKMPGNLKHSDSAKKFFQSSWLLFRFITQTAAFVELIPDKCEGLTWPVNSTFILLNVKLTWLFTFFLINVKKQSLPVDFNRPGYTRKVEKTDWKTTFGVTTAPSIQHPFLKSLGINFPPWVK